MNACSKDLADKAVREFAVSILHGDKAHQGWLIEATERFIAGKKPPKPPRLTSDQVVERYAPQGACPKCDKRRKADGY